MGIQSVIQTDIKKEIFISYSRRDIDAANRINTILTEYKITVWYDQLISPGVNWREAIVSHLGQAKVMLILLSENAQKSNELKKELALASSQLVPLLGVRLANISLTGAFAYELTGLNWFDVFEDEEKNYKQLAIFLQKLVNDTSTDRSTSETLIQQFGTGRQKALPWYQKILHDIFTLLMYFLAVTAIQFWAYNHQTSAIERLTDNGVSSLQAIVNVLVLSSIGSPLLFLTVLKNGVHVVQIPLLFTSLINTVLILFILRNLSRRAIDIFWKPNKVS